MTAQFQRVVLGVRQHAPREGLRQALDLANLLQAELRGLLVKDEELGCLAGLPFVHEFRPLEGGWHSIDHDALSQSFDAAARSAERLFRDAVKRVSQSCDFEIICGRSFGQTIAAASRPGDVLVLARPSSPAECVASQFDATVKAAFESPASVLLVPSGRSRERGVVAALASAPDDPSIEVASRLAVRAKEKSLVLDGSRLAAGFQSSTGNVRPADAPAAFPARALLPPELTAMLAPLQERLLVLSRDRFDHTVAEWLSTVRRVPVFAIEPRAEQE